MSKGLLEAKVSETKPTDLSTGQLPSGSRRQELQQGESIHSKNSLLDPVRNNSFNLKLGMKGQAVKSAQTDLIEVAKKLGIENNLSNSNEFKNGKFGRATYNLLCEVQEKLSLTKGDGTKVNLVSDGILGPRTLRAIDVALGRDVQSIEQFVIVINHDWTGYDNSERKARKYYQEQNFEFNLNTSNPYFPGSTSNYRISQDRRWNCGPTSSAMAIAPLLGVHPGQLADFLTNVQQRRQGARGMGWGMPEVFAGALKVSCQQLGVPSAQELSSRISRGERIIISVNNRRLGRNPNLIMDRLTGGGHIIALGNAFQDENGKIWFENLDPNGKNIKSKGFEFLSEDDLRRVMKQAWSYSK